MIVFVWIYPIVMMKACRYVNDMIVDKKRTNVFRGLISI